MTDLKTSSLPHVLAGYNPELIPPGTTTLTKTEKPKTADTRRQRSKSPIKSRESPYRQLPTSPISGVPSSGSRSAGRRRTKKTEGQRYEELSHKWDKAKQEVRNEDHEQLREKLILQQELIRSQDEFAEQKRQHQLQIEHEKKEAERQKRQQLEEDLKEKCRQSLEEDKKAQREGRRKKSNTRKDGVTSMDSSPSPTKSPTTSSTPGSRRGNPFRMTLPAMSATPDNLGSSDEEDNEVKVSADAPWHEQQLYKLYGKQADYFLKPKMEVKEKVNKTNPKLRRQGVDELFANYWREYEQGRAGAEVLWQTLRHDSSQRLQQEDANIPEELKEAYGSFARESLKKNSTPVRRMYCSEDDLPEMPRLLDHRKLLFMRKMRHKFDLMYRASKQNEDRTEVLTFNNPLPEFNHGMESVSNYLPSWQDDWSESTQAEYLRWLQPKNNLRESTIPEEDVETDLPKQSGEVKKTNRQALQSMDDDLLFILSRRKPIKQKQKYVFMSEKDAIVKGEFSEKYKDEREYKDIPRPYKGAPTTKSYSALGGMISATPERSTNSSLRHSAPLPTREAMIRNYTSDWEPLSMTALVEYKKQLQTMGEGNFNMGRVKMWSTIPVI